MNTYNNQRLPKLNDFAILRFVNEPTGIFSPDIPYVVFVIDIERYGTDGTHGYIVTLYSFSHNEITSLHSDYFFVKNKYSLPAEIL